eukprot:CAMPEP_0176123272 /NCGR_PEP_ID=MMETSP0120_2-20121206/62109_1 /TAXON_ID=160619 /ORGANISM="Kryptoperidinium foliaceum, Strain CCMP 1326" /LENGTH=52 /DNA_ID=CAMNT_0017457951 /DNA_START=76 /DNA_END=231 /DNA_ORIENTATION=+
MATCLSPSRIRAPSIPMRSHLAKRDSVAETAALPLAQCGGARLGQTVRAVNP